MKKLNLVITMMLIFFASIAFASEIEKPKTVSYSKEAVKQNVEDIFLGYFDFHIVEDEGTLILPMKLYGYYDIWGIRQVTSAKNAINNSNVAGATGSITVSGGISYGSITITDQTNPAATLYWYDVIY